MVRSHTVSKIRQLGVKITGTKALQRHPPYSSDQVALINSYPNKYSTRVPSFIPPSLCLCCTPPGNLLSFPHTIPLSPVHHKGAFFHSPILYLYPYCTPPWCFLSFPHTSVSDVHHQGAFFHYPIPMILLYTTRVHSFTPPYLCLSCTPPRYLLSFPHTSVSDVHHQVAFFHSTIPLSLLYTTRVPSSIPPSLSLL